jgi:iron complex transport system substrate-binding protein
MFKSLRLVLALSLSVLVLPLMSATSGATGRGPQCIVSLSPSATETLFAIGAGPQVQAVDKDSNYPTTGLPTKRIDSLNPSVESIIGICKTSKTHKPDLVVISYDAHSIKAKLTTLGVKVLVQNAPATISVAYRQMLQLGRLTGHLKNASSIVRSLQRRVAVDRSSIPSHPGKTLTAYYELDPTFYSLTSTTFVGSLMKSLGIVNIADAKSTTADYGYPQLSSEYIVGADPKLIFLADTVCCSASATTVAARPGFSSVSAVANGEVIGLNDDVASRWGPRLSQLMNALTAAVKSALNNSKLWP